MWVDFGRSSSLCRLRFLERGVRLIQLLWPMVTSHSPLSRSELLNSERPADKIAAFGWPGGVLLTFLCSKEKCSGNIAMEGLLDCLGGGRTVLGDGFSPS